MEKKLSQPTKILSILIEGNPILRQKCVEVTPDYTGLKSIVERMHTTLDATKIGVGLSAPQIGISINLFILGGTNEMRLMQRKVFINPEVIKFKGARRKDFESCLSVPGITARVERWQKIKIKYYDLDFNEHIELFKGFEARVIQHEYDHTLGVSFHERLTKDEYIKIEKQLQEIRIGNIPEVDYLINSYDKKRIIGEKEREGDLL